GRRVGENPAIPIELAIDADRRKGGRQRARRHDMPDRDGGLAAVEVAHLARAHMRGADGEPRGATRDEGKIDKPGQSLLQRSRRVETGIVASQRIMRAEKRQWIGLEESRDAAE